MAVTTKKLFPATSNATTTVFSPVGIQLNNQDDLDVYVTLSGGTRVLQLRQSTGSTAQSSHPQVNNTDGLYFPAVTAGTTLYNYTLSTDNNTITFNSALPQGAVVFCERRTRDADGSYTSFASGSTIRATDLNNSATESNFTAQDARNKALTIEGVLFDGDQPSTNFVTSAHIVNNTIATTDIADDAVTADKLANSINTEIAANTAKVTNATHTGDVTGATSLTIAQDAVTTSKIAADAVVGAKIADNAINSEHYTDGSIDTEHIADDAITAAKLANTSVTAGTYNTANITVDAQGRITAAAAGNANITDGQITTAKIANDAVTTDKLANSIVSDITANNAKVTNVTTNLTTTTATDSVTVNSSDGTNATIGEATSSAAGVMSTAHHDKLDGIEAGATGDQTNAEIRAAVEAASDSNVFTDADHTKLNAIEAGATADQTASEIKTLLQSDKLTASEIATGALDGRYYTETESDARYFNVSSGDTITSGDTFPDNDTTIATTKAINARIIDLVDDVGGFVPIANETSFPTANPDVNNGSGTLVSIKSISSTRTPSSGTVTIANGAGSGNTVTITGCGSTVLTAGFGVIVETTSTLHTYAFHRLVPKATEVSTVAANATNIAAAGANTTNITAVKNNETNINTVAGISGNVTTVAGVASNVTTVAGISSDVTAVANDATDIGVVAGKATEIGRLGTADAVADMNTLGTSAIVSDMDTLADISSNITTVAGVASNVTTVAGISGNVTTVANANSNITTVAGANSNISTVASNIANVNTAATNISNVNNFANTYQIASSNPSTDGGGNSLAAGDLYFNTSSNELKVYNGSSWQGGVTATGNLAGLGANTFTGAQTLNAGAVIKGSSHGQLVIQDSDSTGSSAQVGLKFKDSAGTEIGQIGQISASNPNIYYDAVSVGGDDGQHIFRSGGNVRLTTSTSGVSVTGNIIVSGTVDGVDIGNLNSTVAGITSNATHTGEVTGSGALTIADNVVDEANLKVSNSPTDGYMLTAQSGNTGGLTWAAAPTADFSSVGEHILPTADTTYNLGSTSKKWNQVYAYTCRGGNSYIYQNNLIVGGDFQFERNNSHVEIRNRNSSTDFYLLSDNQGGVRITSGGDFLPDTDSTINIGSSSVRFANGYFDTLYGDGSNLTGIAAGVTSDSQYNTLAGTNAGDAITTDGTNNTAFGYNAITDVTEGDDNTAVGFEAGLQANASTFKNTFIGSRAGRNVTSGTRNTYIGYDAGRSTSNKSTATCIGYNAGLQHDGSDVVCIGSSAGQYVHEGCVSIGAESGGNVSGTYQIFIGKSCGKDLTGSASKNTLVGNGQFASNSGQRNNNSGLGYGSAWKCQGDNNTFVGTETLTNALGASNNTILGYQAGDLITTGDNNIVIGASADPSSATVSNEITLGDTNITKFRVPAIGLEAEDGILSLKTGSGSVAEARFYCESSNAHYVAIKSPAHSAYSGNVNFVLPPNGGTSGYFLKTDGSGNTSWAEAGGGVDSDAQYNTVGGTNAGNSHQSVTTALFNTYFGYDAGEGGQNAYSCTFMGYRAGRGNRYGRYNTGIGEDSLGNLSSFSAGRSDGNSALGTGAGRGVTTGEYNTAIGTFSLQAQNPGVTSDFNTAIGAYAGYTLNTGTENVFVGKDSGKVVTTGSNNTIIGTGAANTGTNNLTTGSNNILLGHDAAASSATVSNEVTIGDANITKFRIPGVSYEISASAVTQGGVFYENNTTVSADYTITNGRNAMAAGPITIASGVTVTIGADETLTIV